MSDMIERFNHGDREDAIKAAVTQVDQHPQDPKAYADLATMLISTKAYDQATELIVKATALFPVSPDIQYAAGLLAYATGDARRAVAYFLPLIDHTTFKRDATYMVALSYQSLGETKKALAFALTAHEAAPHQVDAAILTAQLLMAQQAFSAAVDVLMPLKDQQNAEVFLTLGLAMTAAGQDGQPFLAKAKQLDANLYESQAQQIRAIDHLLQMRGDDHDTK